MSELPFSISAHRSIILQKTKTREVSIKHQLQRTEVANTPMTTNLL